jgi:hypothetical protein
MTNSSPVQVHGTLEAKKDANLWHGINVKIKMSIPMMELRNFMHITKKWRNMSSIIPHWFSPKCLADCPPKKMNCCGFILAETAMLLWILQWKQNSEKGSRRHFHLHR